MRQLARRLLVVALLLIPAAGWTMAQTPYQRVEQVLSTPGATERAPAELAQELAKLGPDVSIVLVELLETPAPPQREAFILALRELPARSVSSALRERAHVTTELSARIALLRVLRYVGSKSDLGVFLSLADPSEVPPPGPVVLGAELRGALTALYRRDPPSAHEVLQRILSGHPVLVLPMIGATQGLPGDVRIDVLCRLLGLRQGLDPLLLRELCAACQSGPVEQSTEHAAFVRTYLDESDPELLALAAFALGALQDHESVAALVTLLEHEDAGVKQSAHMSLCSLSKHAFPAQAARWRAWFEREERWYRMHSQAAFSNLLSHDRVRVLAALQDLGTHRYRRHELASHVEPLLNHPELVVVLQALAVLRQLGSSRCLPALVDTLAAGPEEVTAAAHTCLVELTGRRLSADPQAWRAALAQLGVPR